MEDPIRVQENFTMAVTDRREDPAKWTIGERPQVEKWRESWQSSSGQYDAPPLSGPRAAPIRSPCCGIALRSAAHKGKRRRKAKEGSPSTEEKANGSKEGGKSSEGKSLKWDPDSDT